ncbi:MAG: hypothetical protein QME60_06770 [Verrucomicrobiota bacterium]|nr:hypothetical protein [Verrucomicrobiota bacterium]
MRRSVLFLVPLLLATAAPAEGTNWVRIVDIAVEPGPAGQDEYTIKITPERTRKYDELRFECVYHQEFPWQNFRGEKCQKVHEPVSFTFRRAEIELVNELDAHVSFRVPMDREALKQKHGEKVFNPDYPITVSRMKISGIVEDKPLWTVELPPKGKHVVAETLARQAAELEKERRKKEDLSDLSKPKVVLPKTRK